ncbi:MAG: hypothetical protein A2622_03885 [Bdellovibrionales bacterium RIFCSPHIGHO2_01_FULL_40_29]|nr:MAG: hypothetical protein A2622_03885 [Bdellovibrionales bacterium RIFCSPHIGHO2_01_FULL_40_29]OFZ35343.1 MAG: hypothetical protein A3D17_08145 [Bdellovibrionales bacterium RIFCSPHIGHO2_02_FULL_40_15]
MRLIAMALLLTSATAFANTEGRSDISYSMAGLEIGFKWASAELAGSDSNKQVIGFQIGGSAVFDVAQNFAIKSGLFYNERPFESTYASGTKSTGKITYFDIPLFVMFKFEESAGVYLGPSLSIKMANDSSPGGLTNIKGMVVPLTIGGQFKFAPNMGVNIYFEAVSGELAAGVENSRAVGANIMMTFD